MGICFSGGNGPEISWKPPPVIDDETQRKQDEALMLLKSRFISSGSSSFACLHTEKGLKGANQDAMVVWENFLGDPETTLVCVIDGHGAFGHDVAQRVRDSLPSLIAAMWKAVAEEAQAGERAAGEMDEEAASKSTSEESVSAREPKAAVLMNQALAAGEAVDAELKRLNAEAAGTPTDTLESKWEKTLTRVFAEMDREISGHTRLDAFSSGAAVVVVVKQGKHLVIGNLGDCRAVLARRKPGSEDLEAIQLTEDHKCSEPRERERIRQAKGRVFALEDEPHVMRVWVPHQMRPGLAMSRAIGDVMLKRYGVTCMPDVSVRELGPHDCFVVLGSDGVWDVVSNEEAVKFVAGTVDPKNACKVLVETAKVEWAATLPHCRRDDCTSAVLYFSEALAYESSDRQDTSDEQHSPPGVKPVFRPLDSDDSNHSVSDRGSVGGPEEAAVITQAGLRFFRNDTIGNLAEPPALS